MNRAYANENNDAIVGYRVAVGQMLRASREAAGMSQKQAVSASGVLTQACLSNYENGKRDVPVRVISVLAETYRVPVTALIPA